MGMVALGCASTKNLAKSKFGTVEMDLSGSVFLSRCAGCSSSNGNWESSSGTSNSGNGMQSSISSSKLLDDELLERFGVLCADVSGVSSGDEAVDVSVDQFDQFVFK
jgi:hypothetical protein